MPIWVLVPSQITRIKIIFKILTHQNHTVSYNRLDKISLEFTASYIAPCLILNFASNEVRCSTRRLEIGFSNFTV